MNLQESEYFNEMERLRKPVMAIGIAMKAMFAAVCILPIALVFLAIKGGSPALIPMGSMISKIVPVFFVIAVLGIALAFLSHRKKEAYRAYYKEHYVDFLLKKALPNALYSPFEGISESVIAETELIKMGNRYKSEDLISIREDDYLLDRADVTIKDEHTDADNQTSTVTLFDGKWIILESERYTAADLQVVQKGFKNISGKKGLLWKKNSRRHEFATGDVSFNSVFRCYCQNEDEANAILTPVIREWLCNLANKSDGNVMVGFVGNKIHVAICSPKGSLEPPVYRPVSDKDAEAIMKEIDLITSFVKKQHPYAGVSQPTLPQGSE